MKRLHIPSSIGFAGLLLMQAACADSPTDPRLTGPPELQEAQRYLDVQVRNDAEVPVYVSLELQGFGIEPLGIVRAGTTSRFEVSCAALDGNGPVRMMAISVAGGERFASDPVQVMAGWAVDISITSAGTVARAYPAPREY